MSIWCQQKAPSYSRQEGQEDEEDEGDEQHRQREAAAHGEESMQEKVFCQEL